MTTPESDRPTDKPTTAAFEYFESTYHGQTLLTDLEINLDSYGCNSELSAALMRSNTEIILKFAERAQEQAFKLGEASERAKTITVPEWMKDAIRKQAIEECLRIAESEFHGCVIEEKIRALLNPRQS